MVSGHPCRLGWSFALPTVCPPLRSEEHAPDSRLASSEPVVRIPLLVMEPGALECLFHPLLAVVPHEEAYLAGEKVGPARSLAARLGFDFIEGDSLRDELLGKRLPESQVVALLKDILGILDFIHSYGVIHRDIKPSNIIRRKFGFSKSSSR